MVHMAISQSRGTPFVLRGTLKKVYPYLRKPPILVAHPSELSIGGFGGPYHEAENLLQDTQKGTIVEIRTLHPKPQTLNPKP